MRDLPSHDSLPELLEKILSQGLRSDISQLIESVDRHNHENSLLHESSEPMHFDVDVLRARP